VIPIVFARVQDPIGSGFVGSLARPGGNITGFADGEASVVGKLVELMREIAPDVTRVAVFASPQIGIDTQSAQGCTASAACSRAAEEAKTAASLLGLRPTFVPVQDPHEIEDAIVALAKDPNGGLIVPSNPFLLLHRKLIIELAARHKLPVIYSNLNYVRDGGLMFYGVDQIEQYRGAAGYVDRILKGTRPSDLPIQLPIKYRLVVNLRTAKALGLGVPLSILMRIDEVIE
jgi:putative ABC transport system substrate-binding protein